MGGPKESLVNQAGQSLLDYQLARLAGNFSRTLILSGPYSKGFLEGGIEVLDPPEFAGLGPSAGLLAALRVCSTEWLALMPIDCPYFPPQAFLEVLEHAQAVGSQAAKFRALGFTDHENRHQWLPGLYHRDLRYGLETALERRELSLGRWFVRTPHVFFPWSYAPVDAQHAFLNLNTPGQAASAGFTLGSSRESLVLPNCSGNPANAAWQCRANETSGTQA